MSAERRRPEPVPDDVDQDVATRPSHARMWVLLFVLAIGALVLGSSFRVEPGSPWFSVLAAGLGVVWLTGSVLVQPRLPRLHAPGRRAGQVAASGLVTGLALALVFLLGGLVVQWVPWLDLSISAVLVYAQGGVGPLIVAVTAFTALAEEVFFRGVLYDQIEERWPGPARLPVVGVLGVPVLATTLLYGLVTVAAANLPLVLAGLVLSLVVGRQRAVTGGLLAPAITHVTWSVTLLLVLPPIFVG